MGVNLLIIEADPVFRLNLTQRLRVEKFTVFEAEEESNANRILRKTNVDVVLLGLKGLKREGVALIERIKRMRPLSEIILINRPENLSLSIEGMRLGAFDDFLLPLNLDSLIRRIREACRIKRKNEKTRKSFLRYYQDMMVAASFAEAGEAEMARSFLKENRPGSGAGNPTKKKG